MPDPSLALTVYPSLVAPEGPLARVSWPALAEALGSAHEPATGPVGAPVATPKAEVPLWGPHALRPHGRRRTSDVETIHALALDLDGPTPETFDRVVSRLGALGLSYVVHSTWSHTPSTPKLRIVVPLATGVTGAAWEAWWHAAVAWLDAADVADQACKDPARIYHLPCHPGGYASPGHPVHGAMVYHYQHGRELDPSEVPASGASVDAPRVHVDHARLSRLATRWTKSKVEYRSHMGHVLATALRGEPFAQPGERDTVLFQLSRDIMREIPDADPVSVADLFRPALSLMGPDAPDVESKMVRAAEVKPSLPSDAPRIRELWQSLGVYDRDTPYTPEELAAILHPDPSLAARRWIVVHGRSYYYRGPYEYHGPFAEDGIPAAHRYLSPSPCRLWSWSPDGRPIARGPLDLALDYGTVATSTKAVMGAERTTFDARTSTLIESCCPIRSDLRPEYNPHVDRYLHDLAGQHYRALVTWIAHVTDLQDIACALVLTGPPGVGKSLLAMGLSRLWSTVQPTPLESVMGNFNEALMSCPLVLADESIPHDAQGRTKTADLRRIISERVRPLRRKYRPESTLEGAARLIITANNESILAMREDLSPDDIQAIADRFYHIPGPRGPAGEALATWLRSGSMTDDWVAGDVMAQHALYLTTKRDAYPRQGRFLLARQGGMARSLAVRGTTRSDVCQFLVSYLLEPRKVDVRKEGLLAIVDGTLYVSAKAVVRYWTAYMPEDTTPRLASVVAALGSLTSGEPRRMTSDAIGRPIDTETLRAWARATDYTSDDALTRALAAREGGQGIVVSIDRARASG